MDEEARPPAVKRLAPGPTASEWQSRVGGLKLDSWAPEPAFLLFPEPSLHVVVLIKLPFVLFHPPARMFVCERETESVYVCLISFLLFNLIRKLRPRAIKTAA